MAVSACLTAGLHSEDVIFHWSDSSLVAMLLGRPNEHLLDAELRRIVSKNSDINVNIGGRSIMLRIPLSFDLTPIDRFKSADDLYKTDHAGSKEKVKTMNQSFELRPAAEAAGQVDAIEELPVAYVEMDAHGAVTRANRLTRMAALQPRRRADRQAGLGADANRGAGVELRGFCRSAWKPAWIRGVSRRSIFTSAGVFRVYDLYRNLIRNAEGKPVGMRVVNVDVTETHTALQEALRARQWLESVLDSMADAVILTDALGMIRNVNPAAEELFGWKGEELVGKEIEKALSLLSFTFDDNTQHDVSKGLEHCARGVAMMLDRERKELWVEIRTSPIVDKASGVTKGVVSVMRRVEENG